MLRSRLKQRMHEHVQILVFPLPFLQADMYARARRDFDACVERAATWDEFMAALDRKHMVLAPW